MRAFCSTSSTVVPVSCRLLMMSKISCTRMGARPMEGSSSMSRRGLLMRARPMASICCSPPERVPALWPSRSFRRGKRSKTISSESAISLASLRVKAPISRFSRTLICRNTRRPSGHRAMPLPTMVWGGTPSRLWPSNSTLPWRGLRRPATVLSVVDLPAPLAPMRVTISPSSTSKEIPFTAWMEP